MSQVVPGVLEAAERFVVRWHEEEEEEVKSRRCDESAIMGDVEGKIGGGRKQLIGKPR